MRTLLFLLVTFSLQAQINSPQQAEQTTEVDTILWFNKVPISELAQALDVDIGKRKDYQFTIKSEQQYQKLVGAKNYQLGDLDFKNNQVVITIACRQCQITCHELNRPCHRNACRYSTMAILRRKTK